MNRIILTIEAILFAGPITLTCLLGCSIVFGGIISQIERFLDGKGWFTVGNEKFINVSFISVLGAIALFSLWRTYLYTMRNRKIVLTKYIVCTLIMGCGLAVYLSVLSETLMYLPSIIFCGHLLYVQHYKLRII